MSSLPRDQPWVSARGDAADLGSTHNSMVHSRFGNVHQDQRERSH